MNYLLLFALCVTAGASLVPEAERVNGENGWYVPQHDGSFKWLDLDEAEVYLNETEAALHHRLPDTVTFFLYTKSNPSEGHQITASYNSIINSPYNHRNPTIFTIHGWKGSKKDYVNQGVREALLENDDYNIIAVDWSRARSVTYAASVLAVEGAGRKVAKLIDFLVNNHGLQLKDLEIVGHSLGAHVAGHTGKHIGTGKAHTIVGLDPALPLFHYNSPAKRLAWSDAHYVESIQTNGGKLGFLKPIGKGAFYPNGGKFQPGCGADLSGSCSHGRSVTYFVESIKMDNFATVQCEDYQSAVAKNCGSTYSSVRMGNTANAFVVNGQYYVPVNKVSPFGKLE